MRYYLIIFILSIFSIKAHAQNRPLTRAQVMGSQSKSATQKKYPSNNQSIEDFVEGKYYKNSQTGLRLQYGYISSLNTYGLTFKNAYGNEFYFINCSREISSDNQYMELTSCMNPEDGSGVGTVGIYKNRIIVSASDGSLTYYLEN
jgi:hypothetical protein